ncbi:tripartite tricarboxylate transporter substrate-binding protein [Zeimonas arvi]|uniref:ABC transporter substrate-binding protein n=1 Tax=Zeimonas arvi TaxID=2498847 RepID=A0A5C8NSJ9_9BURK|nr:tripartite tricarboxylate transporter substrate-binding protein [Zeimonas arvi]TXL64158.1 ABC transporter substrate-binding protein [Zeimonas arvi]
MKKWTASLFALALLVAGVPAGAQALQGGPLKIVVPYPPGGSSDRAARLLSERLSTEIGVPVIVENRPGAGGRLAAQQVRNEGASNTLLLANPAIMVVAPLVFGNVGYDPVKDYQPVSQVTNYEFAVAVGSAVPVREFGHLLAWMRANPEKSSFGVPATGSLPHFFALMLGEKTGVDAQVIGYKGSAPLATDLIGGHVPLAVDTLDTLEPQHAGGRLRILAVSGERRSPGAPEVPTFREIGIDLVATGWNTLFAPAGMPADKIRLLSEAVARVMSEQAVRARFAAAKMEPVSANAARTAASLDAYRAQWAPVVQRSGYRQ